MIILISGATHTGKTNLAQNLLNKLHFPYLSIDHLKMGLVRSKICHIDIYDDEQLTIYLWKNSKEIIFTNIENNQNLIIEGIYIPNNWQQYFNQEQLQLIKHIMLIMSQKYIVDNFDVIIAKSAIIENRDSQDILLEQLIADNKKSLANAQLFNHNYILFDKTYKINLERIINEKNFSIIV